MAPLEEANCPAYLRGKVWVPRMIVDQFNSINITCVLKPLFKLVIKTLMELIHRRRYDCWLSVFVSCFILLREIAHTSDDAFDHGIKRNV